MTSKSIGHPKLVEHFLHKGDFRYLSKGIWQGGTNSILSVMVKQKHNLAMSRLSSLQRPDKIYRNLSKWMNAAKPTQELNELLHFEEMSLADFAYRHYRLDDLHQVRSIIITLQLHGRSGPNMMALLIQILTQCI